MSLKNNLQNKLFKLIASQKQVKKNYISILMVAFPECLLYKWRGDKKGNAPTSQLRHSQMLIKYADSNNCFYVC